MQVQKQKNVHQRKLFVILAGNPLFSALFLYLFMQKSLFFSLFGLHSGRFLLE